MVWEGEVGEVESQRVPRAHLNWWLEVNKEAVRLAVVRCGKTT